jgi:hypothetical protein
VNAEPIVKYCYATIRCKACSKSTALKFLGIADGKAIHTLVFPPLPLLMVFSVRCGNCGESHQYIRTDVEAINSDQAPAADFADQMPLATVVSTDVA